MKIITGLLCICDGNEICCIFLSMRLLKARKKGLWTPILRPKIPLKCFFKKNCLLNFDYAACLLLCGLFSSCGEWGLVSSCCAWASDCGGFSCCGAWALERAVFSSCGPGPQWLWFPGSVVVEHGLSGSEAYRIFPGQGSNPCLLHWQVDSLPLSQQGSLQMRLERAFTFKGHSLTNFGWNQNFLISNYILTEVVVDIFSSDFVL